MTYQSCLSQWVTASFAQTSVSNSRPKCSGYSFNRFETRVPDRSAILANDKMVSVIAKPLTTFELSVFSLVCKIKEKP